MCFVFYTTLCFQWDKPHRLIWKLLSFPSLSSGDASVWTFWLSACCKSGFIPCRQKTFKVCHSEKLKSWSYKSTITVTYCSQLLHHFLTRWRLSLLSTYPLQVWPSAVPLVYLLPSAKCIVSRSTRHCQQVAEQGIQSWTSILRVPRTPAD